MVYAYQKKGTFHKNGWNLSLWDNLIEIVREEYFFCITWDRGELQYNMWFRYGEFNYFEIYNIETDRVKYCSDKNNFAVARNQIFGHRSQRNVVNTTENRYFSV